MSNRPTVYSNGVFTSLRNGRWRPSRAEAVRARLQGSIAVHARAAKPTTVLTQHRPRSSCLFGRDAFRCPAVQGPEVLLAAQVTEDDDGVSAFLPCPRLLQKTLPRAYSSRAENFRRAPSPSTHRGFRSPETLAQRPCAPELVQACSMAPIRRSARVVSQAIPVAARRRSSRSVVAFLALGSAGIPVRTAEMVYQIRAEESHHRRWSPLQQSLP